MYLSRGVKPSKSAPYMSYRAYLAGLDIRSIDTHHETSAELSKPPGHDGITSWYLLPVHMRSTPEGAKSVDFVNGIGPVHEFSVTTCGF